MISPKMIFQKLLGSVDFFDLFLIVISSGMGIAIVHHLAYPIKWIQSGFFILWIIFFFLGSEFLNLLLFLDLKEGGFSFRHYLIDIYKLLAVLFFSLSIIPLIQIIKVTINNYLVIYLMCIICLWAIIKNYIVKLTHVFGVNEIISSFVISFITPLIIMNINEIQVHEILIPISFIVFLEIIAFKFIREFVYKINKTTKPGSLSFYIGYITLIRIISFLIIFGYIAGFFLLNSQGKYHVYRFLLFSIPLTIFIVVKIVQFTENPIGLGKILSPLAFLQLIQIEAALIIGLWGS
jgi:hypothetical protein